MQINIFALGREEGRKSTPINIQSTEEGSPRQSHHGSLLKDFSSYRGRQVHKVVLFIKHPGKNAKCSILREFQESSH